MHYKHLLQTAELLRQVANGNKDFLAVAVFLEKLAKVYQIREGKSNQESISVN